MNPNGRLMIMATSLALVGAAMASYVAGQEVPETPLDHQRRLEREDRSLQRMRSQQQEREHWEMIRARRAEKLNGTSLLNKARRAVAR